MPLLRDDRIVPDEEIYADYLKAILLQEPVYTVWDKHKCSHQHVYNIVRDVETQIYKAKADNARKEVWTHKYEKVWIMSQRLGRSDAKLRRALVRDMYFRGGFSIPEIAEYTKYGAIWVQRICGKLATKAR